MDQLRGAAGDAGRPRDLSRATRAPHRGLRGIADSARADPGSTPADGGVDLETSARMVMGRSLGALWAMGRSGATGLVKLLRPRNLVGWILLGTFAWLVGGGCISAAMGVTMQRMGEEEQRRSRPELAGCGSRGSDGNLAPVLATIRQIESGDYTAQADGSSASGAYQILDSTWGGYRGYERAYLAPPEVQDARAAELVTTYLEDHDGDLGKLAVRWYVGHVPETDSDAWDTVPHPEAGNTLTPRQYQAKWMDAYEEQAGAVTACEGTRGGAVGCPPGVQPEGGTEPYPRNADERARDAKETETLKRVRDSVLVCFGRGTHFSCYDRRDGVSFEHPRGRACDFGIVPIGTRRATGPEKAFGDALADWLVANHGELGVIQVIWDGRFWMDGRWTELDCSPGCAVTAGHHDHVHVSVRTMPDDPPHARCDGYARCNP